MVSEICRTGEFCCSMSVGDLGEGVNQDYSKALEWSRKSAEQGNADAQFNLGYCYMKGIGVEQNLNKAVEWHKKMSRKK